MLRDTEQQQTVTPWYIPRERFVREDRLTYARRPAALLLTCVLLAALHTWPLVTAPHRYSRMDNADYQLNAWAISWVAHQLPRDPLHLFDANMFWPEPRTLAFSEAMIVQGVMASPLIWMGASPILAYNLVMLAGFVLTGFFFGMVARRWTGSWTAAYVTASAAGFNAHLFTRLAHLQAMHDEFVAVVLLGMDLVFTRQRVRDALLLGVGFALQGLTSIYLLTFTTWAAIFAAASRMATAARGTRTRAVGLLTGAGVVAVLLLSFYLLAYVRLHEDRSFARAAEDNQTFAGKYTDYLSTVSHAHYWWSKPFVDQSSSINFPGFTVLALVGAALAHRATRRDARVRMAVAVMVGCALASMVARLPGYQYIHGWVPLFWAVRVQAHMGQVVLLAASLVAGYGAWRLRSHWGSRPAAWAVPIVLVVLINAEAFRAPIPWREFTGIPPIYDTLAAIPRAVVVELPAFDRQAAFGNARYLLHSTRHWHPMINGYSGFVPASYARAAEALQTFPGMQALEMLRARQVTHVVIHEAPFVGMYGQAAFDRIGEIGSFQEVARDGEIRIYRFR
ncbi:MAG: hypothetical protein Q7V01_00035 [Vicinamibacterales bacterium]|nr:hypothetical protein [Vicinamibacterales bacterium]